MRQCRFLLSSGVFILEPSNGPFVSLISATVSLKENNTGYVVSISKDTVLVMFKSFILFASSTISGT